MTGAGSTRQGGAVALLDARRGMPRVQVGGVLDGLAFAPGGRWPYASALHGGLAVIDVANARVHAVLDVPGGGALLVLATPAVPQVAVQQ
ncbi:MAG: hypothetical protein FJ035_01030 [Chloroflexi bacterium]|nr:hypothetical protein [Chloroflexota bacterium]